MYVDAPDGAVAAVLLFHGAGGGAETPVLLAVRDALLPLGITVARLDQAYRVAGRRAPDRPEHLDAVATIAVEAVRTSGPLLLVGKSNGARVACRIAGAAGAESVACLGFPLHPPGRPDRTRAGELAGCAVPVLVLQGERDAFGRPAEVRAAVPAATVSPLLGAGHAMSKPAVCAEVAARVAIWAQAALAT